MKFETFEDIIAWQRAKQLAVDVYRAFAHSNDWGFNSQIQRAVISISNNVAEGFERQSNMEFKHFLFIAKGSCAEVRSMLYIAKELNMISAIQFETLNSTCLEVSRMLSALIKSISQN